MSNRHPFSLSLLFLLILACSACGGGGSSAGSGGGGTGGGGTGGGGTGGGGGSSNPSRPFNGDFAVRLPEQNGYAALSSLVYDPALKEVFVSNTLLNSVDVYSTIDGHFVGAVSIPGASGFSLTPDNSELVVGTITSYFYTVDPSSLRVTARIAIPASVLTTVQPGLTLLPIQPFAMADGTIFLGMGLSPYSSNELGLIEHIVLYNPSNGTFTSDDPSYAVQGAARSLDGTALAVGAVVSDTSGLYVYTTASKAFSLSTTTPGIGTIAANPNGSQFAVVQMYNDGSTTNTVTFYGSNLQQQNQINLPQQIYGGPVYSRDGSQLFVDYAPGTLVAINTQTAAVSGYLAFDVGGATANSPNFLDVDENDHLLALTSGALLAFNASAMQLSPPAAVPEFSGGTTDVNPSEGKVGVSTSVQFAPAPTGAGAGDGIVSSEQAYFANTPSTSNVVAPFASSSDGLNALTSATPASSTPGPVSVVLTDASNDAVFMPDAYSFGPTILRVNPNAVGPQGGDYVTLTAYGLGFALATQYQITVGGAPVDMKKATVSLSSTGPFPEQIISFPVPAGTPGWAPIILTDPDGSSTTSPRGVQYLQTEATISGNPYTNAVYDSTRNRFYLTGGDTTVAIFDVATQAYLAPLTSSQISSGSLLEGLALTPDASKLLVADTNDRSLIVFDLTANTSSSVSVVLPADPPPTTELVAPGFVQVAANDIALVEMQFCSTNQIREVNLAAGTVRGRKEGDTNCGPGTGFPQFGQASTDGSVVLVSGTQSGESPTPPAAVWEYTTSTDAIAGPTMLGNTPWLGGSPAVNSDGSLLITGAGVLDQRLQPLAPLGQSLLGYDSQLSQSGGLLVSAPYGIPGGGGYVFINDVHNGTQLLAMPIPPTISSSKTHGMSSAPLDYYSHRPLAISPAGDKILYANIELGGVSYFQLSVVPLAVGTVSPATASVGSQVTVHGSGFVSGTTVKIGGQSASCTISDAQTLSCGVPNVPSGPVAMSLANPDGQTYSFGYAFVVQ